MLALFYFAILCLCVIEFARYCVKSSVYFTQTCTYCSSCLSWIRCFLIILWFFSLRLVLHENFQVSENFFCFPSPQKTHTINDFLCTCKSYFCNKVASIRLLVQKNRMDPLEISNPINNFSGLFSRCVPKIHFNFVAIVFDFKFTNLIWTRNARPGDTMNFGNCTFTFRRFMLVRNNAVN